jgi:hypothetical protein
MDQIEDNVIRSFQLAKNDIIYLQSKVTELSQTQERMMELINKMKAKPAVAEKFQIQRAAKRANRIFVASRTGTKIHESNCPFAKNIKPKSKVVFHSKSKALNAGFKACECMKRV